MVKRCIYCNFELDSSSVVDICETCMYKVWGPKMAKAIVDNMTKEKDKGNMELGRVSETERVVKRVEVESVEKNIEVSEVSVKKEIVEDSVSKALDSDNSIEGVEQQIGVDNSRVICE